MVTLPGTIVPADAEAPAAASPVPSYRNPLLPAAPPPVSDGDAAPADASDPAREADSAADGAAAAAGNNDSGAAPQAAIDPIDAQRKLAGAVAEKAFLARKTALDEAASVDGEPASLPQRYAAGLQHALSAAALGLAPGDRDAFLGAMAPVAEASQSSIAALAGAQSQRRDQEWLASFTDGIRTQYAQALDEPTRQALLDAGQVAIRGMVQRGSLDPDAAQAQWRALTAGATTARARTLLQRDPAAFQRLAGGEAGADGSAVPTGTWIDAIPPEARADLLRQAADGVAQEAQADAVERQRQDAAAQAELQARTRHASGAVLRQILADPTAIDPLAIAKHPDLLPAQKAALNDLVTAELARQGSGIAKTYGPGFWSLYQRVNAADGDPSKLADPDDLIAHAGPIGALSAAGADRLRQELDLRATPEGEAEAAMKQRFLVGARAQISGSDPALGIADPKGDALFLRFLATALPAYDAGRAAGNTSAQLLDPKNADGIGASVAAFQRPAGAYLNDIAQGRPGASPGRPSRDALVAAYRDGRVSYAGAARALVGHGHAVPDAAPAGSAQETP
jgi:hypothetical protein